MVRALTYRVVIAICGLLAIVCGLSASQPGEQPQARTRDAAAARPKSREELEAAQHYGARSAGGVLDGWLVDTADRDAVPRLEAAGIRAAAVPLMMTDVDATAEMARSALALAGR